MATCVCACVCNEGDNDGAVVELYHLVEVKGAYYALVLLQPYLRRLHVQLVQLPTYFLQNCIHLVAGHPKRSEECRFNETWRSGRQHIYRASIEYFNRHHIKVIH